MTTALATLLRPGFMHKESAAGAVPSGTVFVTPEGNVTVYQGLKAAVAGDTVIYDNQECYNFTNNSITWAEGQTVYWDPVNLVVSATGFIRIGKCISPTSSGTAVVPVRLHKDARGAFQSIVSAGAALTNSVAATTMSSLILPPNYLQAGDRLKIRGQGIITAHNASDTLTAILQLAPQTSGSAITLATTGAVNNAANDIFYFEYEVQVRTNGLTGTMVGTGVQASGTPGTVTAKPAFLASSLIDTTQPQAVLIQGTWSAASASDSARVDVLSVELQRA